jgi:hypothetical protein
MSKKGNNAPCPCGSGKKYKKCCLGKRPRQRIVMVGSPVPLKGILYDRDTMTIKGIACEGNLIEPVVTFSQTHYIGESGKEKVLTRMQDRVIPNEADLIKYLSSFDVIIAVDTNTKEIGDDILSVSGIINCRVIAAADQRGYSVEILWEGARPFRNCPRELSPEKYAWLSIMARLNGESRNAVKRYCIVSDHDLDYHIQFNNRTMPIFKEVYLPQNFTMMYGKGDSSKESLLNHLILRCDKQSASILNELEKKGCCKYGESSISIAQIPIPTL